jgi:hypothetical protein
MAKVAWTRDGDQWVAKHKHREGRITRWDGPLGITYHVYMGGKSIGGCGGGTPSGSLARAKAMFVEAVEKEVAGLKALGAEIAGALNAHHQKQ